MFYDYQYTPPGSEPAPASIPSSNEAVLTKREKLEIE